MPGQTGLELLARLKSDSELHHIPVMLLTAKNDFSDKLLGLSTGADEYLTKPVSTLELTARANSMLRSYYYYNEAVTRMNEVETELDFARRIQSNLLPKKDLTFPGFALAIHYQLYDKVGGDFFDYIYDEKYFTILLADVSGHGFSSSYFSLAIKLAFEQCKPGTPPAEVAARINDNLVSISTGSQYATYLILRIERSSGKLHYITAGHPAGLLLRKNGKIELLKAPGKPGGWIESYKFTQESSLLDPGDKLLLYTDAAIEVENEKKTSLHTSGLALWAIENQDLPAKEFVEALLQKLITRQQSETFSDDLTLIAIDWNGTPEEKTEK